MHKAIKVCEVKDLQSNHRTQFVDVRSAAEYATGHVPGALNVPLEQVESRVDDLDKSASVILVCQSGKRAQMAAGLLQQRFQNLVVLEGGTKAWVSAGLPTVRNVCTRWALERQVRLGAGLLVLLGVLLSMIVSKQWIYLSGFVGLGLTFAGLTSFCPMAAVLARMPWNRARNLCCKAEPGVPQCIG